MENNMESRLSDLLSEIADKQESTNVQIALILQRLGEVESKINDINSVLRGDNNKNGIITEIAIMKRFFEISDKAYAPKDNNSKDDSGKDKYVSWIWIVDKLMTPVIVAIVIWLLFTVVPLVGGK